MSEVTGAGSSFAIGAGGIDSGLSAGIATTGRATVELSLACGITGAVAGAFVERAGSADGVGFTFGVGIGLTIEFSIFLLSVTGAEGTLFGAVVRFRGVGTRATTVGFVGKSVGEPFHAGETGKKGDSFTNGRFSAATPVVGYGIEGGALVGQSSGGGLGGKGRDAFAAGAGH